MTRPARDDQEGEGREDEQLLSLLSAGAPLVSPPPALRARIMAIGAPQALVFIDRHQGIWLPREGAPVATKDLFRDSRDRWSTRLVRLAAGEALPAPPVSGVRSVVVIKGGLGGQGEPLQAGDSLETGTGASAWVATAETLVLDLSSAGGTGSGEVVAREATAGWLAYGPGIRVRSLAGQETGPRQLLVIEAQPNATLLGHEHAGTEELFVLAGSCEVEGKEMGEGDYHRAAEGSAHHDTQAGAHGCTLICSVRAAA